MSKEAFSRGRAFLVAGLVLLTAAVALPLARGRWEVPEAPQRVQAESAIAQFSHQPEIAEPLQDAPISEDALQGLHLDRGGDAAAPAEPTYDAEHPPQGLTKEEWRGMLEQIPDADRSERRPENAILTKEILAFDAAAEDYFGGAVAVFGDVAVIGAQMADIGANTNQGAAYIYYRNQGGTDNWGLVKKLTATDGATSAYFGSSVAIWDDTVVVGANGAWSAYIFQRNEGGADNWGEVATKAWVDSSFGHSVAVCRDTVAVGAHSGGTGGRVYLYSRNQGGADAWGTVKVVTPSDGASGDFFGVCVSLDGDTLAVGAMACDLSGRADQGAGYIFSRNYGGADNWGQRKKVTASDGAAGDYFGRCLSLDGDTLAVGSPNADVGGTGDAGAVYLYQMNNGGANGWGQVKKVTAPAATTQFGIALSLSSDALAVGQESGAVYLYSRNGGGKDAWGRKGTLSQPDPFASDERFGRALCFRGSALLVGADSHGHGGGAIRRGAAYIYGLSSGWKQRKLRYDSAQQVNEEMGSSVSQWQEFTAVGIPNKTTAGGASAGAVLLYQRNKGGGDQWGLVKTILPSDGAAQDYFGTSVSLSDGFLAVGARGDDPSGEGSGSVYIFGRNWGGPDNWGQVSKLTASDGAAGDQFGWSISLHGDTVAVGAPGRWPGEAYIFRRNEGGADHWGEAEIITCSYVGNSGDQFGYSLCLFGDTVVVGNPYYDYPGLVDCGAITIFLRNRGGADSWGVLHSSRGASAQENLGTSVSLWGDTLAVGAPGYNSNSGLVYIAYRNIYSEPDSWTLEDPIASHDPYLERFGAALSLWNDTLAVGGDNGLDCESVGVFKKSGDSWDLAASLEPSDILVCDDFGRSVSLHGKFLSVGAPRRYGDEDNTGGVYWFYNHWPVAAADSYEGPRNWLWAMGGLGVLENDADENGDTMTAVLDTDVSHGTLLLEGNGRFAYAPDSGFVGLDSFTYHAYDGMETSDTVTVTLNVINTAPVAYGDGYQTNRNTQLVVAAPGVLGNDTDPNFDPLTAVKDSDPSNGTVTLNADGSFTYTPAPGYIGSDSFTYHANDGLADSGVRTVSINVVNHAPVAVNNTYGTGIGVQLTVSAPGVLGNDTDGDGDTLTALKDSDPSHGTVTLSINGSFVYTPTGGYSGLDTFTYHARDGLADSNVATVTINVSNQPPTALPDSYTAYCGIPLVVDAPGLLANDTDPEMDPLTAMIDTLPSHGTLAPNPNGSFTYTPTGTYTGSDSFTYHAYDGWNASGVVTVSLDVQSAADLSITKTDSPDPLCPNETLTYTLTVHNGGICGATGVQVTDNLEWSVNNPAATPSQGSCQVDGTTVTCDLGPIDASASATVTITCQPQWSVSNYAMVSHGGYDPDMYNDNTTISTTVLSTSPTPPMSVTVTDLDTCLLNGVSVAWEPEPSATGYDLMVGATLVENVSSPHTYVPGDNSLRFYKVRSKTQCGAGEWTGNYPGTDSYFVPNQAVIEEITDDDPCIYGIAITFSGGLPSTSWDLLKDGAVVIPNWNGDDHYYTGDTLPHSYVIRSHYNSCHNDSAPYVFADANSSPSLPALGSIVEVDGCVQDGVKVYFTGGAPATSHSLLVDNVEVASGATSPVTYNPGDTAVHAYRIRTYNGTCFSQTPAIGYADEVSSSPSQPSISSVVDNSVCMPTGVTVTFAVGSPATSHALLQDGAVVATNITSPYSYTPGDLNAHDFVVRALNGQCATDSPAVQGTDRADLPTPSIAGLHENACPSTTVVLTTEAGMTDYQWTLEGNPIVDATGVSYTATESGTYGVAYTNGSGCRNPSGPHWVTVGSCPTSPPPVADGTGGTTAAKFSKGEWIPEEIEVTYATAPCSGEQAVILYGSLGNFTTYTSCAQDNAGSGGLAYFDSTGMDNVWFNIVWSNDGMAGHPGYMNLDGTPVARSIDAHGLCGLFADDHTDGVCD